MLNEYDITKNKERFCSLVDKITRNGFDKDRLIDKLQNSDFFYAPASSKYHCAFEGGLVYHCLNVYDSLVKLVNTFEVGGITEDNIIIAALFHDISKMNFYEKSFSNKKVYSDTGSKYDAMGRYDWVSVPGYSIKDSSDRFVYGSHEQTAEFMARMLIPLTVEESVAIIHHMGGQSWDSAKDNIAEVYSKYPLATLLHLADMISTYVLENN